jgi:acyl-CoA reductase-like NAD-dependent aldehyde dehydrogenase
VVGYAPDIDFRTLESSFDKGARAAVSQQSTQQIQKRLRHWAERIGLQRDGLARIISLETGKPIRFARVEVAAALATLEVYCARPPIQLERGGTAAQLGFSILNWCDPALSTVKEAATVLSSGRALVIKPSSRAPLASRAIAALWSEGDDLDTLLCVAPSKNAIGMLRAALMSPRVTEVRFQGSREVGNFVAGACHEALVPVTISEGKRLPLVLQGRADVHTCCDVVISRAFLQPLPSCFGRVPCLYVHDSIADSLIPVLIEKVSRLHVGDPLDDETDIGPVIDDVATALISEQIEDALFEGASLSGGQLVLDERQLRPMVLDHAKSFMRVCNEDLEGPLLPVVRFSHSSELPSMTCLTIDSPLLSVTTVLSDSSSLRRGSAH